jgi:zinc transport system substrate-binding protein
MIRNTCCLALLLAAAGCAPEAPAPGPDAGRVYVATSFYPVTWFAERIAGDAVEVACPVPDDVDPARWRPTRDDVAFLQRAALIVLNGADFEPWVAHVSLPPSRVVDTAKGFADTFLKYKTVTHSHGQGGEHTHEGIDGHTWLDPQNAKAQAKAILDALTRRFPDRAQAFAAGHEALARDLDGLHRDLEALAPRLGGVTLLASHQAYDYLARRYGLTVTNLDLDPSKDLDAEDRAAVEKARVAGRPTIVLWEAEPSRAAADALEALGVRSVWFSPGETLTAAMRAEGVDYLGLMRANLDRLRRVVER